MTAAYRLAVSAAWLAFIWATTHWYSWQRTIDLLFGSDQEEYERVAKAAPHFPHEALPSQHANRFVPHYLTGLVSDVLHVGVRPVYYVLAIVLLLGLVLLLDQLIAPLGLGRWEYALCIGAFVGNPYLFRFLSFAPARLADSVFILGTGLALLGMLRGRAWLLVLGLVVATLGRAEGVLPLLALAPIGIAFLPVWRAHTARFRGLAAAAAVLVPLGVYGLVVVADDSFSRKDHPGFWHLTIFGVIRDARLHTLALHSSRVVVGIAGAVALIAGALLARRRLSGLRPAFWVGLAAGLAVSAEAWILSPDFIGGNSGLLSAFGTLLLVAAAAAVLCELELRTWPAVVAVVGLALISLHHLYSSISPVSTAGRYGALASVSAVAVAGAIALGASVRRAP